MIADAGDLLLRRGLLTEEQLRECRMTDAPTVFAAALKRGWINETQGLPLLAEAVGLDVVDLRQTEVAPEVLRGFPQRLIYRHNLLPLRIENGMLVVATPDPLDLYPLDEASAATGMSIKPVAAERTEILRLIKRYLGVGGETIDGLMAAAAAEEDEVELLEKIESDGSELSEMAQEASVVRLVNEILLEAIETRASDVHVESQADGIVVRYRIDGMLHTQPIPPEIIRFQAAIISRLKIMARLNIAEKRLPQDGRIKLRVHGREVDVRVSVIPMIHGESIVMRILDKGANKFDLKSLGMDDLTYSRFQQLINLPHGIVLVTGPTGSGKTTTLYSALLEINHPDTKIITTEDPVEYQLAGINQIQVHHKIGLSFAASLRAILRHDPDVVLIGEIRDLETAENAIQASLTGHLVFSTLHTNDAAGSYTRLVDMGVEPFLVASTVEGVMAQRLIRRFCHLCKEPYQPRKDELPDDFPFELLAGRPLYHAKGCRECRGVGYAGRIGIYELLVTSDSVRQMAHDRKSSWELRKSALADGMRTLRMDGWDKVLEGNSSIEEVLRATKGDRLS